MFGITDLGLFMAGTVAIILLPGPNSLYVLAVSAQSGMRHGYAAAAGVFLGDSVLMLLTALGAASVLKANPLLFAVIRWAGAAYLGYLGIRLIISAVRAIREIRRGDSAAVQNFLDSLRAIQPPAKLAVCQKALAISLLNPKAILFFLSFFVQFVDPTYPYPGLTFLLLGCIVQILSLLYLSALIVGGVRLSQAFAGRKRLAALLKTTVGLLFVAFAVRLAS